MFRFKELLLTFIAVTLLNHASLGQLKYEQETKVHESEVPTAAKEFVDRFEFNRKVKWYLETRFKGSSYEAKTKFNKCFFSIEFDSQGSFEDLEINIDFSAIPANTRSHVQSYLSREYGNFKLIKVQIQYSGNKEGIVGKIVRGDSTEGVVIRYEIVVGVKVKGTFEKFEYLFNTEGAVVKKERILLKMTDNLEY